MFSNIENSNKMRCFTTDSLGSGRADCEVVIEDAVYTEADLQMNFGKEHFTQPDAGKSSLKHRLKNSLRFPQHKTEILRRKLPILGWIAQYSLSDALLGDFISGMTVGIVHIPQGMAFALLAGVPAVTGLYVSFFSALIYSIFGTSRHMSLGTFAVMSLMVGGIIDKHVPNPDCSEAHDNTHGIEICEKHFEKRKLEIAVAISMSTGILQLILHIFRMGIVKILLSSHMVSGFVCAASFHVLTSQMPRVLGIDTERHGGTLGIIYSYIDIFSHIKSTNVACLVITVVGILILGLGKEINSRYRKKLPFPLSFELVAVIIGIVVTKYANLQSKFDVVIVGEIPTGFQVSVPKIMDISNVFLDSISIAIIAFTAEVSLSEMMAKKHGYKIDSNQELMALGVSNIIGSFFNCIPGSSSLSRTLIWSRCGGKTQMAGLITSTFLLIVIFWLGPALSDLPHALLASIILINLKPMMTKFKELPRLWKISKYDCTTWIVSYLVVLLLGVQQGLPIAVVYGMATVIARTRTGTSCEVGNIEGTTLYRNKEKYTTLNNSDGKHVIYQFGNPIYFANVDRFREGLVDVLDFDPDKELIALRIQKNKARAQRNSLKIRSFVQAVKEKHMGGSSMSLFPSSSNSTSLVHLASSIAKKNMNNNNNTYSSHRSKKIVVSVSCVEVVTVDMTYCAFVDNDGAQMMKNLIIALRKLNIRIQLANCNDETSACLKAALGELNTPVMFASLDDAARYTGDRTTYTVKTETV